MGIFVCDFHGLFQFGEVSHYKSNIKVQALAVPVKLNQLRFAGPPTQAGFFNLQLSYHSTAGPRTPFFFTNLVRSLYNGFILPSLSAQASIVSTTIANATYVERNNDSKVHSGKTDFPRSAGRGYTVN